MIPSVIVFDLGKVLVDFDYSIAARRILARSRISFTEMQDYLSHSPLLIQYETGLITRQEFYEDVRKTAGFAGDIAEFGNYFADIFSEIPPMIELHATLRQKKFPAYIFSNTNDLAVEHIRRNFPFFANFDGYILSYEHGAMKPNAKLYEVVERETGRQGAEILYIDDREENVLAGKERGWQVILQETPEKTRAALEKLQLLNQA
ncbi:MAG TPA: HAD family phosphatase [Verrucomicrobiae bacterium]|nr:HAD family phosphatase [Verrucomicrobiae bacterium]